MNARILIMIICLILTGELAYAQSFPPPLSQWNKFPVWGNAGIGTNNPSEKLDVRGNVKVSQTIFTNSLQSSSSITGATLSLSGNGIINGYLGLGVTSPTERLDVLGNIKLSGNLSAQGLNIQTLNSTSGIFNTLTVSQNSLFNGLSSFSENASFAKDLNISGKLGIGVSTPSESLDINGNLKLTGGINAASLSAGQGTFVQGLTAGNSTINGSLEVSGALSSQSLSLGDITAANTISVGNDLTVTGLSKLNGGATLGGNSIANNLQVTGTLNAGNISISEINTTNNATVGQNLSVTGSGQFGGNVNVTGDLTANTLSLAAMNSTGSVAIGNNFSVTGLSDFRGGASITGNTTMSGDLQVAGTLQAGNIVFDEINTNGNATIAENLVVNGTSQLVGELTVTGAIKASIIEASEFRTTGGGSPFNFENAKISQTLSVGTDKAVPANYKIAVGGNILATGIDIKIPQKWPDYVFTDGHKLLTIEEVKEFIKANGHLPNVLSEEEMKKKESYNVAEMDSKLLEKMEEMMLYIIQLKEEINALKSQALNKSK